MKAVPVRNLQAALQALAVEVEAEVAVAAEVALLRPNKSDSLYLFFTIERITKKKENDFFVFYCRSGRRRWWKRTAAIRNDWNV